MVKLAEKKVRLSHSNLWMIQEAIYRQTAVGAWTQAGVPSYLTSNPYTANQFAHLVLGFIRDGLSSYAVLPIDSEAPLYILDLGAGSGRFAYQFLKCLIPLVERLFPGKIAIRYVMTDIVEANCEFWKTHPQLQDFIRQGVLDCASYHHGQRSGPIKLQISGEEMSPETCVNPLVLVGNYFFDTLPHDLFAVENGSLFEGNISIHPPHDDVDLSKESASELLEKLKYDFHYTPIYDPNAYYDELPELKAILQEYAHEIPKGSFLMPVGGFQSLKYFEWLSGGRYFLIAADQGMCTLEQVAQWGNPVISRHGSFSMAVNYHAMHRYFQSKGGASWITSEPEYLFSVFAGVMGAHGESLSETEVAFREQLDAFEPKDYWRFVSFIDEWWEQPPLEFLILILKFGCWDPNNFHAFYNKIRNKIPEASPETKRALLRAIDGVLDQFYPICKEEGDFLLNLGVLLFEMGEYRRALELFQHSLDITGDRPLPLKNMAACYMKLEDLFSAQECLLKAKECGGKVT